MASPYFGSSGGSSPYFGGGSGGSVQGRTGPPKKSGGGILGAIEHGAHAVAGKLDIAANDIKAIPGGLVQAGKAGYHDVAKLERKIPGYKVPGGAGKGGYELPALGKAAAKQTVTSFKHPLRDPFQTALNAVAVLSAGAGAAGKLGAAADAARTGDAAGAAKALVTKPKLAPRILKSGEGEVALVPSKNPAMRLGQKVYDKALQHGLDTNPQGKVAAHAQRRIGGALDEEARIQQRMRAVPAARLDRAAGRLSKTPGARREEQAALELASSNTTPAEAAAYHLKQAEKGVHPDQNHAVARLYQRVGVRGLLRQDEHGNVVVNAADHPKLAKADEQLARVQALGDKTLVEKGVRGEDVLAARRDAPARIRAGATFEKPTPGKAGVSPALVKATSERDRIASLHEKALQQDERWHAAEKTKDLGPLSEADAKARLAQLDTQHDALAAKIVPEVSRYGGDLSRREQLARNYDNSKLRSRKQRTVKQEELAAASDKLHEIAAKGGSPTADALSSLLNEREQLRAALNSRTEAALAGEAPGHLPRAAAPSHLSVPPLGSPFRNRIVQTGHALELAQEKVDRIQKGVESRVKPTGIVGGEAARPGRGFVSARISEKKLSKAEFSGSRGPVVGAARSPIDSKTFTGRSLEQGLVPKDVTGSASRHYRQILQFENTDAMRRRALTTGSDVRRSNRDVLVREPDVPAGKISTELRQTLGQEKSVVDTPQELATQEGLRGAHQTYLEAAIPSLKAGKEADAVGTRAPDGFKWVDKGALGDLATAPAGPKTWIGRQMDNANSAVTAATVYFKVGHMATREFTNAATNIVQGSATPLQIKQSLSLWHALSDEDKARALAAAGQHGFASLPHEGTSLIARIAGKGAQFWARRSDAPFRFNSLAYEARKAGLSSPAEFRKLLDDLQNPHGLDGARIAKVSAVARRADREAIAYDRLNNFERRFITRAFWFYPWTKGATSFAGHTIMEHPYKAAGLGAAGAQGREQQAKDFGPLPDYEGGLFKVAGGAKPLVADFSTFSPFSTPADVLDAAARPGETSGFLNPVYASLNSLINGMNQNGNKSKSPVKDALAELFSPTPESQIVTAYLGRHQDQSRRMFPKSPALGGTRDPLMRALLGPGTPRRFNVPAGNSAAARQKSGR